MDMESAKLLGVGVMTLSSLLGAYYLILRIREFHAEKPDPKLTYATNTQLDKVKAETFRAIGDAVQDLRTLRAEIRDETRAMQKQLFRDFSEARDLISQNAQSISALAAQSQIANQRLAELTLKTDRISVRCGRDS